MSAYLTRMPAGIPGDVSRKEGATIESSLVGSKAIPYGAFVKLVSGKLEPLAASDTAAVIYGLAVRPYPKQSDAVGFVHGFPQVFEKFGQFRIIFGDVFGFFAQNRRTVNINRK